MQSYQLTKTVRFKLEPLQEALAEDVNKLRKQGDSTEEIYSLFNCAKKLISALEEYLYETRDQDGEQKTALKSSLEIKTGFLKQHTRQYFYDWDSERRREKNHKIYGVCYLPEALEGWLGRWRELVKRLEELLNRPPEDQPRRAELALVVAEFRKRENFHFIADFVGLSQDKKTDEWHKPLESQIPELKTSLAQCEQIYLPSQTSGVAIARASFNYYTINKRPKNYPKEIKNKRDELKQEMERDADSIAKQIGVQYTDSIREFVIERIFTQPDKTITLDSLYKELKIYKATEKSRFLEAISQDLKFSSIKDDHPLFECGEGDFDTFIQQTKEIKELSDQVAKLDKQSADYDRRSRQLREKITQQKQQRGKFFQRKAKKYGNFCDLFKRIAMKRGKILAAVKGLEREQIDSQLLNYWALIVEKQSSHYLMLIPKDQRKEAYEMLDSEHESPDAAVTIHYFKSLTMRALQKLCFGVDGNTFEPGIREELREQYPDKYGKVIGAFSLGQFASKTELEKETEIVRFYQAVLKTKYVKKTLDIEDFEELSNLAENPAVETRDEFQTELERICYVKRILADQGLERNLLDRCGARLLRISSYDLRKEVGGKGKDKRHTQLWRQFWSSENRDDHYPVRLNPEIKIYWRDARESRIKKYGRDSDQYDPDKHNRFLQSQFTLVTTMTENALGQRYDLAFARPDELAQKIKEFNDEFNQTHARNPHQMYFYGIDRGQAELATLAIVSRFSRETNQFNQHIPEFAQFPVWRLKPEYFDYVEEYQGKGGNKIRRAINNLSYFIDRDDLFKQVNTSSIDLTTAKLIKGRIIENGDVLSYLRLKELSAKRRLYEYWSKSKIDQTKQSPIYFLEKEQAFCVSTSDDPEARIYYYRSNLESVKAKDDIEKMLQDYLQELKTKNRERDVLTIEKINHLRDALAANMVGVMAHLYKQFPGIIVLENLPEAKIESHFVKSNENISRRLEWRLYNRFQNEGLVPPRIKESILLRETKSINQFGLVFFVPTEFTSQECPRCGKKATFKYPDGKEPSSDPQLKQSYKANKSGTPPKFHCPHCGFDTSTDGKEFSGINDPDKVASFNIAKRAYQHTLNPPQDLKPAAKANRKTGNKGKNRSKNNRPQSPKSSPPPKNQPFAGLDRLLKK